MSAEINVGVCAEVTQTDFLFIYFILPLNGDVTDLLPASGTYCEEEDDILIRAERNADRLTV
jgi:hypothetical protein